MRYNPKNPVLLPPGERILSNQNGVHETPLPCDDSGQFLLQNKQIGNKATGFSQPTEGTDLLTMVCGSQAHTLPRGQSLTLPSTFKPARHGVVGVTPSVD